MLVDSLGYSILFLCHGAGLVTATLFVFRYSSFLHPGSLIILRFLPETRNKSLTEIHQMFAGSSNTRL